MLLLRLLFFLLFHSGHFVFVKISQEYDYTLIPFVLYTIYNNEYVLFVVCIRTSCQSVMYVLHTSCCCCFFSLFCFLQSRRSINVSRRVSPGFPLRQHDEHSQVSKPYLNTTDPSSPKLLSGLHKFPTDRYCGVFRLRSSPSDNNNLQCCRCTRHREKSAGDQLQHQATVLSLSLLLLLSFKSLVMEEK